MFLTLTTKVCVWPAAQLCGMADVSKLADHSAGAAAIDSGAQLLNQNCCSLTISASRTGAGPDGALTVTVQVTLALGGTSDGSAKRWSLSHAVIPEACSTGQPPAVVAK